MRMSSRWIVRGLFFLFCAGLLIAWKAANAKPEGASNRRLSDHDKFIQVTDDPLKDRITPSNSIPSSNTSIFIPLISKNNIQAQKGIWISEEELAKLPTSGPAWERLKQAADENPGNPDLSDREEEINIIILAKALVYARTGVEKYRDEVAEAIEFITFTNTEENGNTLPLGRNLSAYVISADLIGLPAYDPGLDRNFRVKLRELLTKKIQGWGSAFRSLQETQEKRPNNWGTHAGASRAAVAVYLGDVAELERTAKVFRGYLGDRSAYDDFDFGDDLSWQCDPLKPVGVNPPGCVKGGHDIGGALPEEMRRGGSFQWPPLETGYPWEGLQGALVQAQILHRAGYPAWEWQHQALLRAVQFLYEIGWGAEGDDEWQLWLINRAYGTSFPTAVPAQPGKNMGWTDWTHAP